MHSYFCGAGIYEMKPSINLIVLRCKDIRISRKFYEKLGFKFTLEKHGSGPEHYASESKGLVLELFPAEKKVKDTIRLGFSFKNLEKLKLTEAEIINIFNRDGMKCLLIMDPDGRRIECTQREQYELN